MRKRMRLRVTLGVFGIIAAIAAISLTLFTEVEVAVTGPPVVWASDPMTKIFRDTKIPQEQHQELRIEAVRNEYAPAQFAITAFSPVKNVRVLATALTHAALNFSITEVKANFVGFVPVRRNTPDTPEDELIRIAPSEFPDPLLEDEKLDIEAGNTQPVWLTIFIPKDAPAGEYTGNVTVVTPLGNFTLKVHLKVYPITIQDERHLAVTNWINPLKVAKYHGIAEPKVFEDEHWRLLRTYARNMAQHRQNVVLTPTLSLVKVYLEPDGKLNFDFSNFDKWVDLFQSEGVIGIIEGGHLAWRQRWDAPEFYLSGYTVYRMDGGIAYVRDPAKATSEEAREFLSQFLPSLQRHLDEKGWTEVYVQHLADEPIAENAADYKRLYAIIKEYAPKIRTLDACQTPEIAGGIDIWVPILNEFEEHQEFYAERQRAGEEVWFYTCLSPVGMYPNRFIDYSLLKVRILPWLNFKYGLTGYLHWGYNHWEGNPFRDVEPLLDGNPSPPGDAFIVYPGAFAPLNSIRFEAFREGLEDYELLWLLSQKPGGREKAIGICGSLIRSPTDYERDAEKLAMAREMVIQELLQYPEV